jgi:hypothetical protein
VHCQDYQEAVLPCRLPCREYCGMAIPVLGERDADFGPGVDVWYYTMKSMMTQNHPPYSYITKWCMVTKDYELELP